MPPVGLPQVIDSLDDIESNVHQFYDRQDDGSYKLTSIESLRNAKNREKEEKKRYRQMLGQYEERFGNFTEQEIEDLINAREKQKKEEVKQLEEKRQWEALKRQMEENHMKQVEETRKEAERNWKLLEDYVRKDHLRQALQDRNATETGKRILPQLLRERVKLALDEDGQPALTFFNDRGEQIQVNGKNEDFTLDDFMEEVYDTYDDLFLGANKSGTGATVSARHASKTGNLPSRMSPTQKADFINQYGEEAYTRLLKLEIEKKREVTG